MRLLLPFFILLSFTACAQPTSPVVEKPKEIISFKPYDFYGTYNTISRSGNLLAVSGRNDSSVTIIDIPKGTIAQKFETNYTLFNLFFSGDSILFAVARDLNKEKTETSTNDLHFYLLKFDLKNNTTTLVRQFYNHFFSPIIIGQDNIMAFYYSVDKNEKYISQSRNSYGDGYNDFTVEVYDPATNTTLAKLANNDKLEFVSSVSIIGNKLYIHRSIPRAMPQNWEITEIWNYETQQWESNLNQENIPLPQALATSPNGQLGLYHIPIPKNYGYNQSTYPPVPDFTASFYVANRTTADTVTTFKRLPIQNTIPWFYTDSIVVFQYDSLIRMVNVFTSAEQVYSPKDMGIIIPQPKSVAKTKFGEPRQFAMLTLTRNGNYLIAYKSNGEILIKPRY